MSSLKWIYKVTRLEQCLIAGLSTWLIALLSNGPLWLNEPKVAAGISMFFSCLGASLFHHGRRHKLYAEKWYDPIIIKHPGVLIACGTAAFICSIVIAGIALPALCTQIAIANFLIILLYAEFLDQYWPFKNLAIALVCVTPIVMGWYSGHRLHPVVPFLMAAIFCTYFAREILKDIEDRDANHGKRFTMVMSLGINTCQRIAGGLLGIAILCLAGGLLQLAQPHSISATLIYVPYLFSMYFLGRYIRYLLRDVHAFHRYRLIDIGMLSLMASTLALRATLY
ncbi:MAG: UbiA family prenyltransferase [Patescibacteria group bacterium]